MPPDVASSNLLKNRHRLDSSHAIPGNRDCQAENRDKPAVEKDDAGTAPFLDRTSNRAHPATLPFRRSGAVDNSRHRLAIELLIQQAVHTTIFLLADPRSEEQTADSRYAYSKPHSLGNQ
jgi:hypothetical protein